MTEKVQMSALDPERASRFQVARASVDFVDPPRSVSIDCSAESAAHGRLSVAGPYETRYLRSLRHYLTRDALPRETHYRNLGSVAESQLRPTLDQLRFEDDVTKRAAQEYTDNNNGTQLKGKLVKFGWIDGVYMRCLLNIWGVMLFLRLTWVVGQAGLLQAIAIICLANAVTVVTSISMSAVATNGQIKGGGIYYMISRSLGPEFGASIGLLFTLSNAVSCAMYVVGFCSSLSSMLKEYWDVEIIDGAVNDARIIGTVTMFLILLLAIVGMEWVTRVQLLMLVLLVAAQVNFIAGCFIGPQTAMEFARGFQGLSWDVLKKNLWSDYRTFEGTSYNFFSVFGVFFPAVTGIVAGANLSGDLKDPATAIPKGTLLAIFTTFITYIIYPVMIAAGTARFASGNVDEIAGSWPNNITSSVPAFHCSDRADDPCKYGLQLNDQVMGLMSAWSPLIYAGTFAATLSSAIASLVGAPRVLQALAKDKLYPFIGVFAKGYGANNDPFRGYVVVFFIALCCVLIGELNPIANLSSEVFLAAYSLINISCFHASLLKSPGWRPTFKYYNAWVSLIGALACIAVMFLSDAIVGTVVMIATIALYMFVSYRKPDVNWGSSTQAQTYVSALSFMQRLNHVKAHVKNYRPQVLVLTGDPSSRPPLVDFANSITKNHSLLIVGQVIKGPIATRTRNALQQQSNSWLAEHRVKAFYALAENDSFSQGALTMMQMSGLGNLRPNVLLMGYKSDWRTCHPEQLLQYFSCIQDSLDNSLAVAVLRVKEGLDYSSLLEHDSVSSLQYTSAKPADSNDGNISDESGSVTPQLRHNGTDTHTSQTANGTTEVKPNGFSCMVDKFKSKRDKQEQFANTNGDALPTNVLSGLMQFRVRKTGFIDVWWLYDDGGLTLLLPYILKMRSQWSHCKLRVFALANKRDELDMEKRTMATLLSKFRIDYSDVIVIDDVHKKPQDATKSMFEEIIAEYRSEASDDTPGDLTLDDSELQANKDKTNRHLRLHELVQEHSKQSSLVVMTLPFPRKGTTHAPLYMAWMEMISMNMPPFLLIRGNQTSVLTFYS